MVCCILVFTSLNVYCSFSYNCFCYPLVVWSVLFKFYLLRIFLFSFCYWFLISFHCDWKSCFALFALLKFITFCLKCSIMCYPRECALCTWKECDSVVVELSILCMSVRYIGYSVVRSSINWSSVQLFLFHYWKWGIEVSYYYCLTVYFLKFCSFLLHIFWGSIVRYMYVYIFYVLLYWSFYQYIMSSFVSCNLSLI